MFSQHYTPTDAALAKDKVSTQADLTKNQVELTRSDSKNEIDEINAYQHLPSTPLEKNEYNFVNTPQNKFNPENTEILDSDHTNANFSNHSVLIDPLVHSQPTQYQPRLGDLDSLVEDNKTHNDEMDLLEQLEDEVFEPRDEAGLGISGSPSSTESGHLPHSPIGNNFSLPLPKKDFEISATSAEQNNFITLPSRSSVRLCDEPKLTPRSNPTSLDQLKNGDLGFESPDFKQDSTNDLENSKFDFANANDSNGLLHKSEQFHKSSSSTDSPDDKNFNSMSLFNNQTTDTLTNNDPLHLDDALTLNSNKREAIFMEQPESTLGTNFSTTSQKGSSELSRSSLEKEAESLKLDDHQNTSLKLTDFEDNLLSDEPIEKGSNEDNYLKAWGATSPAALRTPSAAQSNVLSNFNMGDEQLNKEIINHSNNPFDLNNDVNAEKGLPFQQEDKDLPLEFSSKDFYSSEQVEQVVSDPKETFTIENLSNSSVIPSTSSFNQNDILPIEENLFISHQKDSIGSHNDSLVGKDLNSVKEPLEPVPTEWFDQPDKVEVLSGVHDKGPLSTAKTTTKGNTPTGIDQNIKLIDTNEPNYKAKNSHLAENSGESVLGAHNITSTTHPLYDTGKSDKSNIQGVNQEVKDKSLVGTHGEGSLGITEATPTGYAVTGIDDGIKSIDTQKDSQKHKDDFLIGTHEEPCGVTNITPTGYPSTETNNIKPNDSQNANLKQKSDLLVGTHERSLDASENTPIGYPVTGIDDNIKSIDSQNANQKQKDNFLVGTHGEGSLGVTEITPTGYAVTGIDDNIKSIDTQNANQKQKDEFLVGTHGEGSIGVSKVTPTGYRSTGYRSTGVDNNNSLKTSENSYNSTSKPKIQTELDEIQLEGISSLDVSDELDDIIDNETIFYDSNSLTPDATLQSQPLGNSFESDEKVLSKGINLEGESSHKALGMKDHKDLDTTRTNNSNTSPLLKDNSIANSTFNPSDIAISHDIKSSILEDSSKEPKNNVKSQSIINNSVTNDEKAAKKQSIDSVNHEEYSSSTHKRNPSTESHPALVNSDEEGASKSKGYAQIIKGTLQESLGKLLNKEDLIIRGKDHKMEGKAVVEAAKLEESSQL